ncbi:hypothetical protein J6590_062782 [Homalodisca vitripennis]|nr:hypothetical protein J6590_062782 [Homalodisca vitripennis]
MFLNRYYSQGIDCLRDVFLLLTSARGSTFGRRHSSHFDNKNNLGMPDADKIRRRKGKQIVSI